MKLLKNGVIRSNNDERFGTLGQFLKAGRGGATINHICNRHLRHLAGHLGLQHSRPKTPELKVRILKCWDGRANFDELKADSAVQGWFRRQVMPRSEDDELGIYARLPVTVTLMVPISDRRAAQILDEIGVDGTWDAWVADGNIIIDEMFAWLWEGVEMEEGNVEGGIGELIEEDFQIYLHHQRERNGNQITAGSGPCFTP